MKVKKFFRQDPESLELKEEEEHLKRQKELREIQEMVAEYERMMEEGTHWEVETLRKRMKRRKAEEQKELGDRQKSEK